MKNKYIYEEGSVFITDLVLDMNIGITEEERADKQPVVANIQMWGDFFKAKDNDDLNEAIDYRDAHGKIMALEDSTQYNLLETLADTIVQICLEHPRVTKVNVRLEKPAILTSVASAGIEVTASKA